MNDSIVGRLTLLLLCSVLLTALPVRHADLAAEEQFAPVEPSKLPRLTAEVLEQMLKSGERFVVYIAVASCPLTPPYMAELEAYIEANNLHGKVYDLRAGTMEDLELVKRVLPRIKNGMAPSQLSAFHRGAFVDWNEARTDSIEPQLKSFFARNGLVKNAAVYVRDFSKGSVDPDEMYQFLEFSASAVNLSGVKLDGMRLDSISFGGSRLVGASLVNANLSGSSFAHADLRGADLEGANLENVHWHNTICPDGTYSDANGGMCQP